jgi:hypothetical protein
MNSIQYNLFFMASYFTEYLYCLGDNKVVCNKDPPPTIQPSHAIPNADVPLKAPASAAVKKKRATQ